MPAPPLINSFEGGTDGVAISTSNSGGSSGDAFNTITGTEALFTNVQTRGGMAARVSAAAAAASTNWTGLGSLTSSVYFRGYFYLPANPSGSALPVIRADNSSATRCGELAITTGGKLVGRNAAGANTATTGATSVTLNAWFRLELRMVASTTVGVIEWRLYNSPDSTSITETATDSSLVLAANIDGVRWGFPDGSPTTPTVYWDDIAVSTTDWIGPVSSQLQLVNKPSLIYLRKNS